ncbi:hypothetical protein [Oceanobacillus sp. CAU 1775]
MLSKGKNKKDVFFSLPDEDRMGFELEAKEKEEKEIPTEKIFNKLNGKDDKKPVKPDME